MSVQLKVVQYQMDWSGIPLASGDDDVNTQDGRTTTVTITANQLRISEDGRSVLVTVMCDIHEDHKNYTNLHREEVVNIPIPYDWNGKLLRFVDVTDFQFRTRYPGKNHNWNDFTKNVSNSCVHDGRVKFDDNNENTGLGDSESAGLILNFAIPVLVDDQY
jgi:hypothetical protein